MSVSNELAHTGVRFSLSRFNTREDIDYVIEVVQKTVTRLRGVMKPTTYSF